MKKIIFILVAISSLYAQCDNYSQSQCGNDGSCEWVEDIEYGSCSEFDQNSSVCESTLGCYGAYQYPGWYSGWYCAGGNYQIDNSYCEEIQMLECSEMNENHCEYYDCQWVENINYYSCGNFNQSQCNQYDSCYWTLQYGGSYGQWSYGCGGSYEIDNSYCEDLEDPPPTCAELTEEDCNHFLHSNDCDWVPDLEYENCISLGELDCYDNSCQWVENIQYGNCSNLGEASCDSNPECYYDCEFWHGSCAGCCYGTCYGGSYIISDNSYCNGGVNDGYCTESYELGDVNLDGSINVIDVVDLVNVILNSEYSLAGDLNQDGANNISDIISLINIIL